MARASQAPAAQGGGDLYAYFLGAWSLARTIEDRRELRNGFLRGRAEFVPEGGDLSYREAGRLRLGDYAGAVEQRYRYAFPRPGHADVRFADGRPFFELVLWQGRSDFRHTCGADTYRGTIEIIDAARFVMSWQVSGPRKDYCLRSRYRRQIGLEGARPLQAASACRIEGSMRG